jgi:methylated-DNA-protein-cysteine methyltransferase-like protein
MVGKARGGAGELETVSWWEAFYRVARRIPRGRVCTYGVVAALAGKPRAARHVGFAMAALKDEGKNRDVPWHRVLGARSRGRAAVSIKDPMGGAVQRMLLEAEGVRFDARGAVSLDAFGWAGAPAKRTPAKKTARKAAKKTAKKTARKTAKRR